MTPAADGSTSRVIRERRPRAPQVVLTVTDEMVDQAVPRNSSHCLWVQAVKKAMPAAKAISVDLQTIRFTDPVKALRYTYLTPRIAQLTIVQFDQGCPTHRDKWRPECELCQELRTRLTGTVQLRGGQVTKTKPGAHPRGPNGATMPSGRRTELKNREAGGKVPIRVGGTPPPIGPLSNTRYRGKRRAFGLRALEY